MTFLKSIVAVLVLANVGYALWNGGVSDTPKVAAEGGSGTLRLASEGGPAPSVPPTVSNDGPAGASVPDTAATGAATPPLLLDNVRRCISVGPFRDVSEAARAAGMMRAGGYDPRQRVAEGEVWAGVWVYLPVPAERSAAEQMLEKLKAGGIDDALQMPGPNDSSVISLGLYGDARRAQTRVGQAQALALNPVITDRKRSGNVYWIDIDLKSTDSMLNPTNLQGEAGHIVRLEVRGCPGASGETR